MLKAGAAYLPIDTTYPDARIAPVLTDARAPLCLVKEPVGERDFLPPGCEGLGLASLPAEPPDGWQDADAKAKRPRLRHLHIGLDRRTQGHRDRAPQRLVNYVRWAIREANIDATTRSSAAHSLDLVRRGRHCAFFPAAACRGRRAAGPRRERGDAARGA